MKILNLREVSDLLMVGDMRDEAGISTKYLVIQSTFNFTIKLNPALVITLHLTPSHAM